MANNKKIFDGATIVKAKKLEVLTFALGRVADLGTLKGVIEVHNEKKVIFSKESPYNGTEYNPESIAVVRVLGGKVFINGKYDIYTMTPEVAAKKLKNEIDVKSSLTDEQFEQLRPLFECGTPKGYITPEEIRQVIVVQEAGVCYNEWDPETPCDLVPGDVFLVSDADSMTGYRIGKEEFAETHVLL